VSNSTTRSHARGLGTKTATAITWSWTVGSNTRPGTWPIKIDCGKSGQGADERHCQVSTARRAITLVAAVVLASVSTTTTTAALPIYRVNRVIDGNTIELRNGQRVRLVQIDIPEVYGGYECYGKAASALAKRLLPPGTRVRLLYEPASAPVDGYGRLLRYVVRGSDGLNVNRGWWLPAQGPRGSMRVSGRHFSTLQALVMCARNP